jgi:hypothetical protein
MRKVTLWARIAVKKPWKAVLRIRDPVNSDPWIRDGKKSRSGINIPDHISASLIKFSGLKKHKLFDPDPGSGAFMTLDPGWKNSDPR